MPTETPNQYRQRVADNARKTGAQVPVQNRSNIPNPAAKPMTLPPVQVGSKPVIGPGLPSRINSELGGYRPTGTLKPRG
jgi:hypothetical protein